MNIVRIFLSLVLLYFVWSGSMIAIKISLTLIFIALEILCYVGAGSLKGIAEYIERHSGENK